MKRIAFFLIFSSSIISVHAQLYFGGEFGFQKSITQYDASLDPETSMNPLNSNFIFEQFHVGWRFSKYLSAGIHVQVQTQSSEVETNQAYFEKYAKPQIFFPFVFQPTYSRRSKTIQFDEYAMAGPELKCTYPFADWFHVELGLSVLFFDNRQLAPSFGSNLNQQYDAKDEFFNLNDALTVYRADAQYLNGWNTKLNASFRLLIQPFRNRSHSISAGISSGRCLRQNYAVNYRTSSDNSPTQKNILHASNYGEYCGISIGYSYSFQLPKTAKNK